MQETRLKILIVDDEEGIRNLLRDIFETEGYQLALAENGREALEQYEIFRPDLIIADIKMPKMDGLELLQEIRSKDNDVLIVLMTGYGSEEYAVKAVEFRANNYLHKPINQNQLKHVVKKYESIVRERTFQQKIIGMFKNRSFTLEFGNDLKLVSRIADRLMLETVDALHSKDKLGIHLGLVELITNAIEHGNLAITYDETSEYVQKEGTTHTLVKERMNDPKYGDRKVTIQFNMDQEKCEWLIEDEGDGFDWKSIPKHELSDIIMLEHGRGIYLSGLQFDKIEYLGKGNRVRAVKYL